MDKEELNVGNCPHCTNVLFRDAEFNSDATFMTRCPHCQKSVKVCVRKKVEIVLIPIEPVKPVRKDGGKTGKLVSILLLFLLPPYMGLIPEIFDRLV